jgi:hypothetical protein
LNQENYCATFTQKCIKTNTNICKTITNIGMAICKTNGNNKKSRHKSMPQIPQCVFNNSFNKTRRTRRRRQQPKPKRSAKHRNARRAAAKANSNAKNTYATEYKAENFGDWLSTGGIFGDVLEHGLNILGGGNVGSYGRYGEGKGTTGSFW